jgi:hypothetical protein
MGKKCLLLVAFLLLTVVPGAAAAAPFGNALRLDGIDDYASIADNTTLDLGDADGEDFTIEASFFVPNESSDANQIIFFKNFAYALFINFNPGSPDAIFFRFWACPSPVCELSLFDTTNLTSGWHHIAAVFDNEWSPSADRASIFLDGNVFADATNFEVTPGIFNSTNLLSVGANSGAAPLDGWLDEARFSDHVRYSGAYTVPTSAFSPDVNTRALWHFDAAAGSTSFADSSANGNTLTGQNGAQTGVPPGAGATKPPPADFDGDGDTDLSVWRPSSGTWFVRGQFTQQWGAPTDIPVPGDYDKDGDTDVAVWRPSTGVWFVRNQFSQQWGAPSDIPVPCDYDRDGDTDVAVWRPSTGVWFVRNQFSQQWGASTDIPVPGDYDRDGDCDLAVWRPSTGVWFVRGQFSQQWGAPSDIPVPGDYDRDGDTDVAVWRPSTGVWFVRNQFSQQWGSSNDVPVPGDYDRDGDTDVAVWRPSTGVWFVRNQFSQQWGAPTDIPLPLPWAIYDRYY